VDFLVGFESEFILLKSTVSPLKAVNYQSFAAADKLPSGKVETTVLGEIADAIQISGIELQMYHPEAAPGQVTLRIIS
jgi:glutamine synthetase